MIRTRMFFSPHLIIKYYLLRDIIHVVKQYKFQGSVIDIGCGEKPYKKIFSFSDSYKGIDLKRYSRNTSYDTEKPDFFFNNTYVTTSILPFRNNTFDNAVSFQVLEHHRNPQILIEEMFRIVKKGGLVLLTMPLIWGLHEIPNDYFRFTEYGVNELAKNCTYKVLTIKKQGSVSSTISILLNDYMTNKVRKNKIWLVFGVITYPLLMIFSYSCVILDMIFRSESIFLNYLILLKKTS